MFNASKALLSIALCTLFFLPSITKAQSICFETAKKAGKIRLQLTLSEDNSDTAKVKYEKGSNEISVDRCNEEVISPKSQRPATVKSTFVENTNGKRTGKYLLITTGAAVGELTYIRERDGKKFIFYEDVNSTADTGCTWNIKANR